MDNAQCGINYLLPGPLQFQHVVRSAASIKNEKENKYNIYAVQQDTESVSMSESIHHVC